MIEQAKHSRIKIMFLFAVVALIIPSFFSYIRINNLIKESELVNHTQQVKFELEKSLSYLNETESGMRGYMLTYDTVFLEPFYIAKNNVYLHLKNVEALIKINPTQQQNFIALKNAVDSKIAHVERNVVLFQTSTISVDNRLKGKALMDDVHMLVRKIHSEEDTVLSDHLALYRKLAFITPVFNIILIMVSIVILITSYFKIIKELRISEKLNLAVEQRDMELKLSEERFLKIFEYSPVPILLSEIKTNKIEYANKYFYDTFGYSREEVIGKTSEELNLIAPEENQRIVELLLGYLHESRPLAELQSLSLEETEELLIKLKQTDAMKNLVIYYTRKNGETFPAVVSFEIIQLGPKHYTISSYQDITERIKAKELLKKQNEELRKTNKELESFNYISSHDLQEPLRQIQIFASRIMDVERQNLSPKGKIYFERMNNAADRMRTLIADLLTYSRTTTAERKFENTDLNTIVRQVKSDLTETIDEKHASIEVGEMCYWNIIPFQFRQLMHNLISNSLKFSKPGTPPHIIINSKIIKSGEAKDVDLAPETEYCHISVTDNGIGFEPQYKERIFEVFQRLHDKQKIAGTGIGLAIVKKIVENHKGIITTTSELNKGATFDIYIPENE